MTIFKVVNETDGKVYVGYSVNDNPNNLGAGKYIKRAVKDFGTRSFQKTILEEFESEESLSHIMERLEFWIKNYKADNPTKKLQVLLTPEDEDNLNAIIIQKSMENKTKPLPVSRYVRQLIVEHIVEETAPEKQLIKTK